MHLQRHTSMKLLSIVLTLMLFIAGDSVLGRTAEKTKPNILPVPVFFVTDRETKEHRHDDIDFGAQLNDPLDHIVYGVRAADIPAQRAPATLDRLSTWAFCDTGMAGDPNRRCLTPTGTSATSTVVSAASTLAKSDLIDGSKAARCESCKDQKFKSFSDMANKLRIAIEKSGTKSLLVFVHGCCVGFRKSVQQAGDLAASAQVPVVMYDWGSPWGNYAGSALACPRSQERFNQFLMDIAREFPEERIGIVALSMGGQLVDNFCLQHKPQDVGRRFDDIYFARADMDSVVFKSHLPNINRHSKHIYIYSAHNDFQINLSGLLRIIANPASPGRRLGHTNAVLKPTASLSVIDVSALKLNHLLPHRVIGEMFATTDGLPNSSEYAYSTDAKGVVHVTRIATQESAREKTRPVSHTARTLNTPNRAPKEVEGQERSDSKQGKNEIRVKASS